MDAQRFLAEFGHIAGAQGGIQQIRELILTLAMQGKLFLQDSTDAPASELLEEIAAEKRQLVKAGKLKAPKSLQPLKLEDAPYSLPKGWEWIRLGNISEIERGGSPRPIDAFLTNDPNGLNWIKIGDTEKGSKFITSTKEKIKKEGLTKTRMVYPGDFLLTNSMSFGRPYITLIEGCIHDGWLRIHPPANLEKNFLYLLLSSPVASNFFGNAASGAVVQNLNADKVRDLPIPLPPLAEQARIVAKVDELMALCDKLESQQQSKQKLARLYRSAALNDLTIANSPDEISKSWIRVQNFLNLWANEPQAIDEFRNVIGALAFRGVLTEGYSVDISQTTDDSLPELPVGWKWETLGSLTEYITSGSRGWKTYLKPSGDIFIRSQDIKQDALIFDNRAFVSLPEKVEGKRTLVQPNDLLLTITGGNVGKCAQVPILECKAYVSQHVALMRLKNPSQSEFLHFWMTNAYGGRKYLARYIYGDKPGLNLSQVANVPVLLPPSDIQEKIVKQLRHYKILCDQLITQSQDAVRTAELFAAASVSVITGIRNEEEEEALKTPKTELISKLRLANNPDIKEQAPLAAILARHQNEMSAGDLWQRYGGEIDAFYAQLKQEVGKGWIAEPAIAEIRETEAS